MNEASPELRPDERAALWEAVAAPVPDGFAARVTGAWMHERRQSSPSRVRLLRPIVAGIAVLAAAILLAWLGDGWLTERIEQRERQARLAAAPIDPPPELATLRARTHALLAEHCVPCHDAQHPGADEDALAVFDTRHPRWWLTMSQRQFEVMMGRMASEDGLSTTELEGVQRYVDAELAFRRSGV